MVNLPSSYPLLISRAFPTDLDKFLLIKNNIEINHLVNYDHYQAHGQTLTTLIHP